MTDREETGYEACCYLIGIALTFVLMHVELSKVDARRGYIPPYSSSSERNHDEQRTDTKTK